MKTTFILLSILLAQCSALLRVGMTEFIKDTAPEFLNFTDTGECAPSFECDILTAVCDYLDETCSIVPLPDLDARFGAIEDGTVDFTISINGVTLERAERVHFVRPHHYYAGSQIYVVNTTPESEHPSWEDLDGENVCMFADFYSIPAVEFMYGANVVEVGIDAENIINGTCKYVVTSSADGSYILAGLAASTKSPVEFGQPYAIAVPKDERDGLGAQIGDALVSMMNQGEDSLMLEFEQRNLIAAGFPPNKKLLEVIMTITENGGPISAIVEDAIWDA